MLVAKLDPRAADLAYIDPRRLLRDAFEPGDIWFVSGDFFRVDTLGDYWLVDRSGQMIVTRLGAVASNRIEDALYEAGGLALCIAAGRPDPDDPGHDYPVAAIQLHGELDLDALSAAARTLPEYARPRRIRLVDELPLTDGFRPIKRGVRDLDMSPGPNVLAWDPRAQRYEVTAGAVTARGA
jgi:acyl-CoA synthetase (AMP-forming)/AMP-acid ligase II